MWALNGGAVRDRVGFAKHWPVVATFLFALAHIGAGPCTAAILFTGVNLDGAEFGTQRGAIPGVFGTDYTYPLNAEIDYFANAGMNAFRLGFRWERLQRVANGDLDPDELGRIDAFVAYATAKRTFTLLVPFNYGRYYPMPATEFNSSPTGVVGGDVPNAAFADFWKRVALHFKGNDRVIFDLMNEPANMDADQWVKAANAAIAAIRAAGAANLILVPAPRFSTAASWDLKNDVAGPHKVNEGRSNADSMLAIVDSGNNFAVEIHLYFDDGSGKSDAIAGNDVNLGGTRLTAFNKWLHANKLRGFLGEFAVANSRIGPNKTGATPQIGAELIDKTLGFLEANSDVWLGWTWHVGGPWWPGGPRNSTNPPYMFLLDPNDLGKPTQTDKPAMGVLKPHFVAASASKP